MRRHDSLVQLLAQAVLVVTTVFVLFPYAWMVVTSIRPIADVVAWPIRWIPRTVTFENYAAILGDARFLRSLLNSAVVSVAVTAISLALSVPAAYGLTRLVRGGGRPMLVGVLASQFFPCLSDHLPKGLLSDLAVPANVCLAVFDIVSSTTFAARFAELRPLAVPLGGPIRPSRAKRMSAPGHELPSRERS